MTAIDFFQAVKDWGEKDICTKGVSNSQNEGEGRGGAIGIIENIANLIRHLRCRLNWNR